MPKDNVAPSQNWNIQEQINQSKKINQENASFLDAYKKQTDAYKNVDSILTEYENQGVDTSGYRKKLDEKANSIELGFGEKLGTIGRNVGNDYVSSFAKAFGGNLENTYSQRLDDAKQKREEAINPISTIATEVALDPLTYTPLSFASKGTKAVRMAKDFGKGAGLSAGLYTAKEYGDDNYKATDSAIAGAFGGGLNALLGRVLNRKVAGDLTNPDATSGENITNRILFEQNKLKPDVVAAPTQPIGDEVVQENIIKPNNNQDDIAAKINQTYFGGTQPEVAKVNIPEANNGINSQQVNDFFNPIDKNIVQAQGNKNLPTPASQQDPFVYNPNKPVDTFGFVKDAEKNSEITQLKQNNLLPSSNPVEPRKTDSGIYYSNGTQTFGGGAVGGMESEFNQRDYNNDGKHDYKDNIYGTIVGAIGVNAAKKLFPKAFKDGNIDKNTAGSFVGKNPTDTKDLMIQHNLSQDNLKFANQNRGLLAPSLATVKKDMPIDGFGDITLLGDKNLATPTKDMKAFASDIYSPRYPRESREYLSSDIRKVDNSLIDYIRKTGGGDVSTSRDISDLADNVALKAKFLEEEKGITLKIPNRVNPQEETLKQFYKSEYKASITNKGLDYQTLARDPNFQNKVLEELKVKYQDNPKALETMTQPDRLQNLAKDRAINLDQIGRSQNKPDFYKAREITDKQIAKYKAEFDEYVKNIQESYKYKSTFYNNGKDVPYSEQNILKYLTSNLRGGENWNYGGGSVRALVTPEFKTIEQIKKAKDRLITSKEFEVIRESVNNELLELGAKVARNSMEGVGVVTEYMTKGKAALRGYDVDNLTMKQLEEFKTKLKEMPTEYFESKYLGKLELSNFKLAIIPKNASKETKEILAKNGIKYKTYDPKLPDSRIEVIKREAEKNNVLFASPTISGGMVGGITGATSDLDGDGKITYKDIAIGALGGAGLTKGALMAKNSQRIVRAVETFKSNENVNAIYGFNINKATDYLKLRDDVLKATNQKMEQFSLLHEQLKLLDTPTRNAMYDYMSGKNVQLSQTVKSLADNYINEVDKLSKELVDLGVLDAAQFDKFKGRYLHRRYEKDFMQKFTSLFSKGKTVQGIQSRGREWTGSAAEYNRMLANNEIGDFFQGKVEATQMRNGQYKFRQDWTDEQRARWGEVKDIAFSLPETLMRSSEMVQHATFLKRVLNETGYVLDDATDGYVQLNGKKYGALNGKYVRKDIASDVNEFNQALFGKESDGFSKDFMDTLKSFVSYWKKTHTVYNPVAHVNNLLSNITMQFGAGLNPIKAVANAKRGYEASSKMGLIRQLEAKKIIGLSNEETNALNGLLQDSDIQLWKQASEAGLFGRSKLNDVLMKYIKPSTNNRSFMKQGLLGKIDEKVSAAYQAEDDIMRYSVLKSFLEQGMDFDTAVSKVSTVIPDYTKPMSYLARKMRDTGIAPFVSWTYHATPIILNQMKEHPERVAAIYGALYGINQLMGIDPFNEKDIPQQNFSMKRIPIYKDGNEVTTIKVDRWIPHNDIMNPGDFIKNLLSVGIYTPLIEIPRNQNLYFGGKITHNEGALKAYDLTKYALSQVTPDALDKVGSTAESLIMSKNKRTKNPVVQPRSTLQELINLLGINSMTYNKANQAKKIANEKIK